MTFEENKELRVIVGELIACKDILGHLILDADGQLTAIAPSDLKRIEELPGKLAPTPAKELAAKVLKLLPPGFKTMQKEQIVICYNTSDVYARWNLSL
ncbi:MAG: hypothetical protein ACOVLE_06510, partial [Pirellula staleyi]